MPEDPTAARLYVLAGPDLARSFALGERATLGRSDECDVVLHDRSISRKHALLARQSDSWFLQDLGSTNGISKDGKRSERFELVDGDEFLLGELPLRFRLAQQGEPGEVELAFAPGPAAPVAAVAAAPAPPPVVRPATAADDGPPVEEEIEIGDEGALPGRRAQPERLAATMFTAPRAARRTGLFGGDIGQHPWWWRGLVVVLLLAFSAGLCYGAFWAVQTLRSGP